MREPYSESRERFEELRRAVRRIGEVRQALRSGVVPRASNGAGSRPLHGDPTANEALAAMASDAELRRELARLEVVRDEPDSLERIREDARKFACNYWGGANCPCEECPHFASGRSLRGECNVDMRLDLIERTVKVMEGMR